MFVLEITMRTASGSRPWTAPAPQHCSRENQWWLAQDDGLEAQNILIEIVEPKPHKKGAAPSPKAAALTPYHCRRREPFLDS